MGSQAPIVPTKILGDPVELDRHLIETGYAEAFAYHPSPSNYNSSSPYIYGAGSEQLSEIQLHVSLSNYFCTYLYSILSFCFFFVHLVKSQLSKLIHLVYHFSNMYMKLVSN